MLLQGNLQLVFEALHRLGVIDPVLKSNWSKQIESLPEHSEKLAQAVQVANEAQGDPRLLQDKLDEFDEQILSYLAMEVARELADYQSRKTLH